MTRWLGRWPLLFLLLRLDTAAAGSLDFFELNNAQYEFNIDAKPIVFDQIPDDNDTLITVANRHGQQFVCTLPERPKPLPKDLTTGTSVNPKVAADVVAKHLHKCIKMRNGWWTYTLCPRKSVTQSHGKTEDKDYVSNSLGLYTGAYSMPTTMTASEGEKMLFLVEKYDMGAVCDITGAPRSTVVHYTCEPLYGPKDAQIMAIDEEASCEYKVQVRTGALCSIPQFQPPRPPATQPIQCAPVISTAAATKLKKRDAIRKENREKAIRELAAIKAEYEETKTRRWSIERRRVDSRHEEFDLKMRDLDEDYIDLTRDQLEWNIVAKTGEEPNAETKETIADLLDGMEAIETAQVVYDSIADEDRANLWHFFHNPKWRADGFPLLLDEVDVRNGFAAHVKEMMAELRPDQRQTERLKRLLEFGHPSRLEAVIAYAGADSFALSLVTSVLLTLQRTAPGLTGKGGAATLTQRQAATMSVHEWERRVREAHRSLPSAERPAPSDLIDLFAYVWAIAKVAELNPMREDSAWSSARGGLEAVTVAESVDRLQTAWKFFDLVEMALQEDRELAAATKESAAAIAAKYAAHREALDRVKRSGGEIERYYELTERGRDPAERRATLATLAERVETAGRKALDFTREVRWEIMRPRLIFKARMLLPAPSATVKLANGLGQDSAVALFREDVDARAIMDQLAEAGLGSDKVKLQIHYRDGYTYSAEDEKVMQELIEREMKDARIRERAKARQRAYDFVLKREQDDADDLHLV